MPKPETSLIYHSNICSTTHCQCNRLGSEGCSLFHGIFHYQQCIHSLAFFFLSRWKNGFIKGDGLLGRIFSNVFFSLHVPKLLSGKRHSEKLGKIWWRDQKEREGQWGEQRDRREGGSRNGILLPLQSLLPTGVLRVIPPSRACFFFFRCKDNKTRSAALRHQNGRFWLQRVFRCLRSCQSWAMGDRAQRTEGTSRLLTTSAGTMPEKPSPPKMPVGTRPLKASANL